MTTNESLGKIVALLPMKANSSRVKAKNFRTMCGKPLFRWVLDTLLECSSIHQVVINTDARHILAEHELLGCERVLIRDRNADICGDHISMNRVIEDDIKNVESTIYLMTHTTNPLISSYTLEQAISSYKKALVECRCDSLFSVNRLQSRFYFRNGKPINHDPNTLMPTQNLEPWYEENSCFYLFTQSSFFSTNARIGKNPMMYEIPRVESVDIDEESDWDMAQMLLRSKMLMK